MRVRSSSMRWRGAFAMRLGAGAFLARGGQRRIGGLGVLVGFGQRGFGLRRGRRRPRCARFRRWRWRPAGRCACRRSARARASAVASSAPSSSWRRAEFGDLLGGGGAARFPARRVVGDGGKAPVARFAFAAAGFPARRGLRCWRCGLRRRCSRASATSRARLDAIAQFRQRRFGLAARLPRAASTDCSRRRISASRVASCEARSAAARAARVASSWAAISACSAAGVPASSAARAASRAASAASLAGGIDRRKRAARTSLARDPVPVPAPSGGCAATGARRRARAHRRRRHSRPSARDRRAPRPAAGRACSCFCSCRALVGEHQAGHGQAAGQRGGRLDEIAQRLAAGGQRRIASNAPRSRQ